MRANYYRNRQLLHELFIHDNIHIVAFAERSDRFAFYVIQCSTKIARIARRVVKSVGKLSFKA